MGGGEKVNSRIQPLILLLTDDINDNSIVGSISDYGYEKIISNDFKLSDELIRINNPDLIIILSRNNSSISENIEQILDSAQAGNIPIIIDKEALSIEYISNQANDDITFFDKNDNTENIVNLINVHLRLKKTKDELILKNKLLESLTSEKNEFLGIAAHDLKNPIYSISMLAKVIKNEKDLTREEIDEFASDIILTSQRMLDLIGNLLDINKIEQGQIKLNPELINLDELALTTIEIYKDRATKKNIKLKHSTDNESSILYTDRNAVFQIFDNLLSNAIKYSPIDKSIHISISSASNKYIISVEDQGPGIREEEMKLLFNKFSRLSSKPTGEEDSTGLGLSIVKKYTEMLNGAVYCESQYGFGSKFIVEIPAL